jgi:diguanylate cyclase
MTQKPRKGLSFARRMYLPRAVGTGMGFFCVAVGIWPMSAPWWQWALLVAHAFIWPHLAYQLARLARDPYRTEQRSLLVDGFAGGCWVGVMGLNPLPSVIILSMIAMDKIAAGGWPLLIRTLFAQVAGIGLCLWLLEPPLLPATTQGQMLGCLPILLIYPMAIGLICFRVTEQLGQHKRTLARLSRTDSLTGLTNHGAWKDLLQREFVRCQRSPHSNCMALIDIDYFKQINDTYGHLVGDEILRTVSGALSGLLRKSDKVGRYGGDEFCVILPDTTLAQAKDVLERLRDGVNGWRDPQREELSLSLSIGIAAHGPHLQHPEEWLHAADMALYEAKNAGRNCLAVAPLPISVALPG